MSLKTKLSIIFSFIVTIILLVNNTLHYLMISEQLRKDQERQMELVAKEIGIAIEHSKYGSKYVEELIAQELRTAALAVQFALGPDIDKISNEQLKELSHKLGVSEITLLKESEDDIFMLKSSDEKEINLGTKEWGYWYTAFKQLFAGQEVTVPHGQKLPNYWAGPIDISSSNPDEINKWGYYFDGSTNYMISPYLRADQIAKFEELTGPKAILEKTLKDNPNLLEVTGFNPRTFGNNPVTITTNGVELTPLKDLPIIFGQYTYKNEADDKRLVQEAITSGEIISSESEINGKRVIKSFIPVSADPSYVIGLVSDYQVIQDVLDEQLYSNLIISLIILAFVFMLSYLYAGYVVRPVQHILKRVNEIAQGNFGVRLASTRKDELGLLSNQVDVMSQSLEIFTEELKNKKELMQYQAYHDPLTGLPNRLLFHEQLEKHHASPQSADIAIIFLDLDRFKNINDTMGHRFGDLLLIEVTRRVSEVLHKNEKLYRLGGDEFILMIPGSRESNKWKDAAERVLKIFVQPFYIGNREFFITASLGISFPSCAKGDTETLIKSADLAMYSAKEKGGNQYQVYTPQLNERVTERMELENNLRKALSNHEFTLMYQPKVNLQTGSITGVEALIRWDHPIMGRISPMKFIPLAEETGMIKPIGEWVIRTACQQNKLWQQAGLPPIRVAVNLSLIQFQDENLVQTIAQILDETKLDPQYLELEMTESVSMYNTNHLVEKLEELKKIGIHISIDDFGTGYSSLHTLNELPIDSLKIDRSFISNIISKPGKASIIQAMIAMAHSLDLKVVAEGVETKEQFSFLKQLKCDEMQGYFFSKPLSPTDFEELFSGICEVAVTKKPE